MHGKDAAVADITGDGRLEIVFAAAFGNSPRLLRRGDDGKYREESERLGELSLNAHGLGIGDLDGDGDLDIVFPDAGERSFRRPGGKARLLLNDGSGHFTDASEQLGAVEKIGAQNPKLIDLDHDFDLDIVLDGKSAETHVYWNDGNAHFTLATDVVPAAKGRPYEVEWADLDGDGDLDAVHMNFTGEGRRTYSNVPLRNELVETGKVSFTPILDGLEGNNAQDQNDLAFFDGDGDGNLDLFVAALPSPPGPEKVFVSSGKLEKASFKQRESAITPHDDSTLDADLADFDGDGRLDLITVQGESRRRADFSNRYYRGTGAPDRRAPRVGRVSTPEKVSAEACRAGIAIIAWIQDDLVDDGGSPVDAMLAWQSSGGDVERIAMKPIGGGLHRAVLRNAGAATGSAWEVWVEAKDPAGNEGRSEKRTVTVVAPRVF